jgi:hypothetical protein
MSDTVFRFVVVRAPDPSKVDVRAAINPYGKKDETTPLLRKLQKFDRAGDREGALVTAEAFLRDHPSVANLVRGLSPLVHLLAAPTGVLVGEFLNEAHNVFHGQFLDEVRRVFHRGGDQKVGAAQYHEVRNAIADWICANAVLHPGGSVDTDLEAALRALEIVERCESIEPKARMAPVVAEILALPVVLPFTALWPNLETPQPGGEARSPAGIRLLGIADLLLVRRKLLRYEYGDLAAVVNALKGETTERTFRRERTVDTLLLTEKEITEEEERDLQTAERYNLEDEANRTVTESSQIQGAFSVSGAYGTVHFAVTGAASYARSSQESERVARQFARETVDRTIQRLKTRTLERRSTRTIFQIEETSKHQITAEGTSVVGFYRYLNKVDLAQVVNYGRRLLLDVFVPEPGAYLLDRERNRAAGLIRRTKPNPPNVDNNGQREDFTPSLVTWDRLQALAKEYGVTGLTPPPPDTMTLSATLEVPHSDRQYTEEAPLGDPGVWLPALGATKVTGEFNIPKGYEATDAKWAGDTLPVIRKSPLARDGRQWSGELETRTTVSIAGGTWGGLADNTIEVKGASGSLPVAVITSAAGLVLTVKVNCQVTEEEKRKWQLKSFEAVQTAYQARLQEYEDELARAQVDQLRVSGNPASHKAAMLEEIRRAAISLLSSTSRVPGTKAIKEEPAQKERGPALEPTTVETERDCIEFFEQAFEWPNTSWVLYPYLWGRQDRWSLLLDAEDPADPEYRAFLRAGYARVQIPVRPGHEAAVKKYLAGGPPTLRADGIVPQPLLPLAEELRAQTDPGFLPGPGKVTVTNNSTTVRGVNTAFTPSDVDREIRINLTVLRIVDVASALEITVDRPWAEKALDGQPYALGPWLVGPPWEIVLPTELVALDTPDIQLPSIK